MEQSDRKLVLLIRETESSMLVYNYLKDRVPIHAIIAEKGISNFSMIRGRIRRIGFWKTAGQILFILLVNPVLELHSRKRKKEILASYGLKLDKIPETLITRVHSVNSDECRKILKALDPFIVLVNGTRIIAPQTLSCCNASFINIHDGITPIFRGVHGGYWALAKQRPDLFGTTIHFVDRGIDTGGIIEQVFIQPGPKDNFVTYPYLQHAEAMPVVEKVLRQILNGNSIAIKEPLAKESGLYHHPTIFEWFRFLKYTRIFF